MPEPPTRVAPRLVVSRPVEVDSTARRKRSNRRGEGKEHGRHSSSEWTDVEESPPRRRRSKRISHREGTSLGRSSTTERGSTSSLIRFLPRLGRISESTESQTASRPHTRSSHHKQRERSPITRPRYREASSSRPPRHRTGGIERRTERVLKVNPSLLSVVSASTGISDKSSGSGSTITQESYDRKQTEMEEPDHRPAESTSKSANVFDFMDTAPNTDIDDGRSVISSAPSSHYAPSDASSNTAPETPSSQSSIQSPLSSGRLSGYEVRAKYDRQYTVPSSSIYRARSNSRSPDPSVLSVRHRPSVEDIPEHDEENLASDYPNVNESARQRSSSRSSTTSSRRSSDRWTYQEDAMRQHMAHAQQGAPYPDPAYAFHRSQSSSPMHAEQSPYQQHMAVQHYQWPSPPPHMPSPPSATNTHIAPPTKPEAPVAPDATQRTLAGYELMALELSDTRSNVQPLYRKFEYLNHRILLHLQDEICELEEQLRHLDEVIAQMHLEVYGGEGQPSSRRGEAWNGHDLHHRRTELLGRVFVKTEQYNRAMSSYTAMARDSAPAASAHIDIYRDWVSKHKPIHEIETRYLERNDDLVSPTQPIKHESPAKNVALAYLPVALMLPLLLFSLIPSLSGRLLVTLLIAGGAFLVAATTRIRTLLCAREWAVCGTVYVLLMAAIAGCIPQYGS